jgi:CBS domain-containing protein
MAGIVEYYRTTSLSYVGLSTQVAVQATDTVESVVVAMADASTSCAFAMEGGALTGIFTEHDITTKVAMSPDMWQAPLAMVMTANPYRLRSDQTALDALRLMNEQRFRNLPVGDDSALLGNLTQYDLIQMASDHLRANPGDDQEAMPDHSLRFINFLGIELADPVTLEPEASLADAVDLMLDKGTGLVSIVGPRGAVIGEFTEHDLFTKVACRVEALEDEAVGDWMTEQIAATDIRSSIADGIHLMAEKGHRYLVLVNETGRPINVATFRDISNYLESILTAT